MSISHNSPVKPAIQSQVNVLASLIHTPPFSQGLEAQVSVVPDCKIKMKCLNVCNKKMLIGSTNHLII